MAESKSPPIVVGDVVAYVSLDNTLNVRDHRTGHPRWDAGLLARRGRFNGQTAPAVVGDVLCAVSPGWVAGFRLSTGDPLWQLDVDIADPVPPSAVDRTVFVGGEDRSLLALNAATGKIRWETQLTRNEFGGVPPGRRSLVTPSSSAVPTGSSTRSTPPRASAGHNGRPSPDLNSSCRSAYTATS
jgi:outer membrane protein assembly factor BamB